MNYKNPLLLSMHLIGIPIVATCAHNYSTEQSQQNAQIIAFEITHALEPFLLTYDMSKAHLGVPTKTIDISPKNRKILTEKIKLIVEKGEPLVMRCLCFPFKSSNKNLVLSPRADMAERQALLNINGLMKQIKNIYPDARFEIIMDGLLFNDLFNIPDTQVIAYEQDIQTLCQDLEHIKVIPFREILKDVNVTYQEFRTSLDQNSRATKQPPADKFELLKKRIALEMNHQKPIHKVDLEKLTSRLLKRDQGMLDFLETLNTPSHLRFSIHLQNDFSKKIGITFLPHAQTTPWNAVLVEEPDSTYRIDRMDRIDTDHGSISYREINGLKLAYLKRSN